LAIKAAGAWKVVGVTTLPRAAIAEVDRTALNSGVKADACLDAVADWGSDPNMGQAGQYTNMTYYDVDQIHPNTNAQSIGYASYIGPPVAGL
jgi:hypothetical protein